MIRLARPWVTPGSFILTPSRAAGIEPDNASPDLYRTQAEYNTRRRREYGTLRGKKDLLDFTVGNILQRIKVLILSRNFDAAFPNE